jgi:hypothetical protein
VSIRASILALAPDLYWPHDELTGLVALDASGNGRDGAYPSGVVLGTPGPEVDTFSLATGTAGGADIVWTGPLPTTASSWSACGWFTAPSYPSTNLSRVYNGNGNINGSGIILQGAVPALLHGGLGVVSTGFTVTPARWHCYVLTEPAPGAVQIFVDGVSRLTVASAGYNAPTGFFHANFPDVGQIAHTAVWQRVLTPTEVASISSGRVNPQESSITGRALTDADAAAFSNLLQLILDSVRKVY